MGLTGPGGSPLEASQLFAYPERGNYTATGHRRAASRRDSAGEPRSGRSMECASGEGRAVCGVDLPACQPSPQFARCVYRFPSYAAMNRKTIASSLRVKVREKELVHAVIDRVSLKQDVWNLAKASFVCRCMASPRSQGFRWPASRVTNSRY